MSKQTKTKNNTANTQEKLFADINVSMKTGRLVKDPELISDGKFAKIRIASNKQYLDADEKVQSTTDYFNALVSSRLTEAFDTAKNLKKGDWVYLKGEDKTQAFDTPEGYRKTETTIFAYHVALKKEKQEESAPEVA